MGFATDIPIYIILDNLLKTKQQNIKEFEHKARELAKFAIQQKKTYTVFRIAKELQDLYCDIEEIEDDIISVNDAFYIYKFAREIKSANVIKLQQAIINTNNLEYIAKFACFVSGSNSELLENIIINSKNARATYIYARYGKHPNIQKLKHILIKSKKPRYLYTLALLSTDLQEIEMLQDLIINSHSNMYVRLFALHIPGANIAKLEERILATKDFSEIQKFAKAINSPRLNQIIMLM